MEAEPAVMVEVNAAAAVVVKRVEMLLAIKAAETSRVVVDPLPVKTAVATYQIKTGTHSDIM